MITCILADPTGGVLTAGLLSLATAGASFAASKAGGTKSPAAPIPATPATPAVQPATPPTTLTNTQGPSFLAAASAPPQANQPGKTLLGQ